MLKVDASKYELIAVALIVVFFIASITKLHLPGPQYDELSFTNIAMGFQYEAFANVRLFGLPVLILPYVTALKSYLFFPIFKLFGVSYLSIRLPLVFLACIGLWFFYKAISNLTSRGIALLCLSLIVLDSTFIGLVKLDVGINAIEMFCKLSSLLLLSMMVNKHQPKYLVGMLLIISIGVISKLNFIWYLNSLTVSLFVYREQLFATIDSFRSRRRAIIIVSSLFAFCYGFYLFISIKFALKSSLGLHALSRNFSIFQEYLPSTISGQAFNTYITGGKHLALSRLFLVIVGLIFLAGIVTLVKLKASFPKIDKTRRLYLFSLLMVISTLGQIVITADANAPWHYFAIYPFTTILIALSIYFIFLFIRINYTELAAKITCGTLILFIIGYHLFSYSVYISDLTRGTLNRYWSDAIYSLVDYTRNESSKFVILDWGLHTQIITYDYKKGKYAEAWGLLYANDADPRFAKHFKEEFLSKPDTYFIAFNPDTLPQSQKIKLDPYYVTNPKFFDVLRTINYKASVVKTINDRRGHPVYFIYTVAPNN